MAPVIAALDGLAARVAERRDPLLGPATLVMTMIEGGIGRNVVPPSCSVLLDRRLLPGESAAQARGEIESVTAPLACEVQEVSLAEAASTPRRRAHRARGPRGPHGGPRGAVPGRGFRRLLRHGHLANQGGIPTVILGPGSLSQAHKSDEHIAIAELEQAVEVYRRLALDWMERRVST